MGAPSCGKLQRHWLSLTALTVLIASSGSPVHASTAVRLGASTDFLERVHKEDFTAGLGGPKALTRLLDRLLSNRHGSSESHKITLHGSTNGLRIHNEAAASHASVLRQMAEERRIAALIGGSGTTKQVVMQDSGGQSSTSGRPVKREHRSIMSFEDIIIWGWKGVYHQCKELERVLKPHYRVRLTLHEYFFPHTDPADDGALYILMTPHLCMDLPPHYIIWQTEQWGHHMLQVGNRRWANQRNMKELLDFVEVFEGAVEVWDYSQVHLKNFEPIFKGKDVKFRHVPFSWFPLEPPVIEAEKDIDVLFYGWIVNGSRRNKMLDELRFERNVSIHVSNMDAYKEDLTKLLRRAKVILNIHAYPAKVLEICRILEAISFDIVVITEPGAEAALDAQWADKLVFADGMDQIVQQIELYRTNSTLRHQKLTAATAHAKAHYSLDMYLADFLAHKLQ